MQKKEDLIRENIELRARLELAEKWMRREVATSIARIDEENQRKSTRIAMKNIFETEGLDILTRKVIQKFDNSLSDAPKYTLERLIDAEIYWNTLQQYPQMDALPIIIAYQKILDAWIEERIVVGFRHRGRDLQENSVSVPLIRGMKGVCSASPKNNPPTPLIRGAIQALDQDITNLVDKKYTLSIGRLYQLLQAVRNNESLGRITGEFVQYIRSEGILDILISDAFFIPFQSLIEREVFSRKRHESKVTYADARFTRDILIDASEKKGLFEMLF